LQFPEKTAKISSSRKTADLYPSTLSIRRQKGETDPMKIQFKVWLEKDQRVLFGEGRHQLLKAIEDYGSLVQAAKKMNMSYRAAWGRLKASEDRLGFPLTEKDLEKGKKGGLRLTPEGKRLLTSYQNIHLAVEKLVRELEGKYFEGLR
jgi:molybdate transport system regulatory protein